MNYYENVAYAPPRANAINWRPTATIAARRPFRRGKGLWILYIHGGAWRDPRIDANSFKPVWASLQDREPPSPIRPRLSGYISIDYRLSPYPATDLDHDPDAWIGPVIPPCRHSQHPDHVEDALSAVHFMQTRRPRERYGFDGNFIVVGHSAGAAMGLGAFSGLAEGLADAELVKAPRAIVGAAGLYDFNAMLDESAKLEDGGAFNGTMRDIFGEAFGGTERERLDSVSPVNAVLRKDVRTVMLFHSSGDGLVGRHQLERMKAVLDKVEGLEVAVYEVEGPGHDEIYQLGWPLANAIESLILEMPD